MLIQVIHIIRTVGTTRAKSTGNITMSTTMISTTTTVQLLDSNPTKGKVITLQGVNATAIQRKIPRLLVTSL